MSADDLLSRLDKVRPTGRNRWSACCPAHEDKHPSLAVRELGDGRVLVKCFADCGIEDILSAVGLDFEALFPPQPMEHSRPMRRAFSAIDVLRAVGFEALVAATAASNQAQGVELSATDRERLQLAAQRLQRAVELATDVR